MAAGCVKVRRIITRVVVFLLLGAIVNVVVAWGCSLQRPEGISWNSEFVSNKEESDLWIEFKPAFEQGAELKSVIRYTGFGRVLIIATIRLPPDSMRAPDLSELGTGYTGPPIEAGVEWIEVPRSGEIRIHERGWPMKSFRAEIVARSDNTIFRGAWVWNQARHPLPLIPIVPGFLLDSLLYGSVMLGIYSAPAIRRAWRRRCGLCEKCAYPVGDSPVCTECGAAVRAQRKKS